jgi:hypothetical protein
MQRVKYNRERAPDPEVVKQLGYDEIECEVGDDGEAKEWLGGHQPDEPQPGMSVELTGFIDDITRIEELHAFCLAHDASVIYHRLPPQIPEHSDSYKSVKRQEAFEKDAP